MFIFEILYALLIISYLIPILPIFIGIRITWYLNPYIKAEVARRFDQFNLESESAHISLHRVMFFQVVLLTFCSFYWLTDISFNPINNPFNLAKFSWIFIPVLGQSLFLYFNPKLYTVYSDKKSNFLMLRVLVGGLVLTILLWLLVCYIAFSGIRNPNDLDIITAYILLYQIALTVFMLTIGRVVVYYFIRYMERRKR